MAARSSRIAHASRYRSSTRGSVETRVCEDRGGTQATGSPVSGCACVGREAGSDGREPPPGSPNPVYASLAGRGGLLRQTVARSAGTSVSRPVRQVVNACKTAPCRAHNEAAQPLVLRPGNHRGLYPLMPHFAQSRRWTDTPGNRCAFRRTRAPSRTKHRLQPPIGMRQTSSAAPPCDRRCLAPDAPITCTPLSRSQTTRNAIHGP